MCAFPCVLWSGFTCTSLPVIVLHHKEMVNGRVGLLHGAKHSTTTGCFLLTGPPIVVLYLLYCSINSCNNRHRYYCWLWTMCLTVIKCLRRNFSQIAIYPRNWQNVSPAKFPAIGMPLWLAIVQTTPLLLRHSPVVQTSPSPSSSASSSPS